MNLLSDSGQFSYIPATKNKNYDNAFFFMAVLGVSPDFEEAVLLLSGAAAVEELSADELERYESLSEHPLDLNSAGRSRLLSCGLFSAYQVASLLDYRNGTGDILSVSELGLVDGFSPGRAAALAHFVRLESRSSPGQRRSTRLRQSVTVGGSVRSGPQYGAKLKYDASLGQTAQLYWTTRTTYSAPEPRLGTMSLAYYGRRRLGKIVLGHFSARFGQGLALWSGFRMSSLSSVDAFSLRGSGFSPTGAADAALLGVASDWSFGRFTLGCAYSFKGRLPILALGWMSKKATIGLTATSRAASLDWRLSFPGLSAFGEFSSDYRLSLCGLAGLLWVPEYGRKYAFQARWFAPQYRNYSGLAAGVQLPWLVFTADAAYRNDRRTQQYKALLQFKPSLSVRDRVFVPALRASMRLRPGEASPLRSDVRADLSSQWKEWNASFRFNALWCKGFAWLWYAQAGYSAERFRVSLRAGLFKIDDWSDRIYVYQQDAPGNFNVPAFYGRGWNASLFASLDLGRHHSLWLRLDNVSYPWNLAPKKGRMELRLQYRWRN